MRKNLFSKEAVNSGHPKWKKLVEREIPLYLRNRDIRGDFARDYNRIIHCTAYRRLRHKTQVFPAPGNDHICTRMEHVNHVASVSYTIANFLGLNTELTNAISVGHDLGHTPFGHAGESIVREIVRKKLGETFWHEMNSLRFVDNFETLEDPNRVHRNLDLTYAVRDGIVCHCGEVDQNGLFPRRNILVLERLTKPGKHNPITWEGCVVKIADKIAYLGRDIEDAIILKILQYSQAKELINIVRVYSDKNIKELNNTVLLHEFIIDLCEHSSPERGINISEKAYEMMVSLKKFNYENIYFHNRLNNYRDYSKLIIESIFNLLKGLYQGSDTLDELMRYREFYPTLTEYFSDWLIKYGNLGSRDENRLQNKIVYDLRNKKDYLRSILDFISGMTDVFSINVFNEITTFK